MIQINGNNIDKVKVNDKRISSVFVNKLDTGRKYFVHYDTTIEIVHNEYSVGVNIDDYAGYKIGFFIEEYKPGGFTPIWHRLRNFTEGPGGNFTVSFPHTFDDTVGYILFMHPFATEETIQKYKNAIEKSYYDDQSGVGQILMDYNFQFLKQEGNKITTKFFEEAGIDEKTCNEECFGWIIVRGFGNIDFIKKAYITED